MANELIFSDQYEEPTPGEDVTVGDPWKVLIIDDESEVHKVTRLALKRFVFDGRPLDFISAYSAREAQTLLENLSDVAVILLDVVMETEDAGLKLVHVIRRQMNNATSRIILRTGQPGQAPERQVIRDYDINDYKAKTELTSQKLFTLMHASLRSYRDIIALERSKHGLEKVINASRGVFEQRVFNAFVDDAMEQLLLLLHLDGSTLYSYDSMALQLVDDELRVLTSSYPKVLGRDTLKPAQLPDSMKGIIQQAIDSQANVFHERRLVIFCGNPSLTTLFFVEGVRNFSNIDRGLLSLFAGNIVVALENIRLNEVLSDSNKEVIYRLSEVMETHSEETGHHVKRVALYCELLAQLAGLSDEEADVIKQASPLHDIGKVGVPDSVLNKQGQLNPDEWEVMKTHAQMGHDILTGSGNQLLDAAAQIARSHHEKWDGSGYPQGLAGEDIPIFGRIAALADVFDALGSGRCYKQPWPLEEILDFIKAQSGSHLDPYLVELLIEHQSAFLAIRERFRDG